MYQLGINVAFPPKRIDQAGYYEDIFEEMSRQGLSIYRLWLSDFSFNYYSFRGESFELSMDLLAHVGSLGAARGLKVIPVLFDFNEFTTTNIHWSDYEHTFQTSFISKFMEDPKDFFCLDNLGLGLSKFFKVREILDEDNVFAWELFNEIDLVNGFNLLTALDWAERFSSEVRRISDKPIYLSFADPNYVGNPRASKDFRIAMHTYNWPYDEFYKNLIYWQNKYPHNWVMEFGDQNATSSKLLVALLASFILNHGRQVALPWFWEATLELGVYPHLRRVLTEIGRYLTPDNCYKFTGELGSGRRSPRYSDVWNTVKLSGWRGLMSKALTTLRVSPSTARRVCHLQFESERQRIIIEADFLDKLEVEQIEACLLKEYDAGGVTVKIYVKS